MLIGLIGKLQSGKTSLANFIKEEYPDTILLAFADSLKEMILNAGLCDEESLWGKKTDFSRLMLQKIGTEIIRKQVDDNFWVKKMIDKILSIPKDKLIIVHDVRFRNEADAIRLFYGKLYRIIRPELNQEKEENKHLSETEQDLIPVDYEIMNDKTIFELKIKAREILNFYHLER